jgi:hypothetical protein
MRGNKLEKCTLKLRKVFLSFLLSENKLLKYIHLCVYIIFLWLLV